MALRARLRLALFADGVMVAESEDHALWQDVLARVTGRAPARAIDAPGARAAVDDALVGLAPRARFAADLGVDEDELVAACRPSEEAPFLTLDRTRFGAFRRAHPARGPTSVAAITLAISLLLLWRDANDDDTGASLGEGQRILASVGHKDANPRRAIGACPWLVLDGDLARLDPARHLRAIAVAKRYCTARA